MTDAEFAAIINETKSVVLSSIEKNLAARFFHAIDDVVQETYFRAYKSLARNKFRGDSTISSWLYAIARNESLRMNRSLAREELKFQKSLEKMTEYESSSTDADEGIIQELYENITMLPDKYRSVIDLVSQGFSEKEIADKLGIKTGTVKSRASRGREILKKIYREENHDA